MSHQEERPRDQTEKATRAAGDFIEHGKEQANHFVAAHSEFLDRMQDINRRWAERLRAEAEMGAEMATKLTASRSFTDAANAIQNWTSKHLEMAAEDTRRAINDTQHLMQAGARVWASAGRGPSEARGLMS